VTDLVDRLRGGRRDTSSVDGTHLADRVSALRRFVDAASGHLPEDRLVPARTVVERSGQRLALSREHTVVALAGSTGSGKSSLFNALARMQLSPVGVRRPTTGVTHACVWGPGEGAEPLLDWLGLLPRHRFARESVLDANDEAALRGLVLLDLPDFDSIEMAHRNEVDRLLGLVDLVIWVVDPQKYADRLVHESYFSQLHQYQDVTVIALNQADRLGEADVARCLADLRGLLDRDGLTRVAVIASSAVGPPGTTELRRVLEGTVASRQAVLHRLNGDVDRVVAELSTVVGPAGMTEAVDRATARGLADALAAVAGVPAVVEATQRAYRHRASTAMGWPLLRWMRRLRPDPLRRLHLPERLPSTMDDSGPLPVTSIPEPTPAARAAVGIAVRTVADRATGQLPAPWPAAVATAARSRVDDLPDALDRAVSGTGVGFLRTPLWWRLVGGLQWLVTLAALGGLLWLLLGYLLRVLQLPALSYPKIGVVPMPTALLLGGVLAGVLIASVARGLVALAARRVAARTDARLRAAVAAVGHDYVLLPVHGVLQAYADASAALEAAAPR